MTGTQQQQLKRTVRCYYGFQFFFGLLIWLPVFYEFQKRIGLNDEQIFGIQSIYYVVFCLLAIPTGAISDRFGYRRSMRWGAALVAASNLLPIFAQSYSGLLAHFVMIALARSLITGASSAYLYDYLASKGAAPRFKEIEGRARAYSLAGKVVFWTGVGALMSWHLTAPYWATFLTTGLSFAFAVALPKIEESSAERKPAASVPLLGAGRLLLDSPFLVFLILQGIAIFVLGRIAQVNLFQPILGAKHFGLEHYGWVMALMTIFEAVGSWFPQHVRRFASDLNAVFALTAVMALSLAALPFLGQPGTLASLSLFSLACGLSYPIQRQLLNDAIPDSSHRATILSVESIADRAVNAAAASLLGASLAGGGLDRYLFGSAGITLAGMFVLWLALRIGPILKRAEAKVRA